MAGLAHVSLTCTQAKAVSDHYPIELMLQGAGTAKAMGSDDSGTARTMSLSFVGVLCVAMTTTRLLM